MLLYLSHPVFLVILFSSLMIEANYHSMIAFTCILWLMQTVGENIREENISARISSPRQRHGVGGIIFKQMNWKTKSLIIEFINSIRRSKTTFYCNKDFDDRENNLDHWEVPLIEVWYWLSWQTTDFSKKGAYSLNKIIFNAVWKCCSIACADPTPSSN